MHVFFIAMVPSKSPSFLPVPSTAVLIYDDDLSFNITLSCTVRESGRFNWTWTDPSGHPPSAVIYSNVTRTSTALFTGISAANDSLTFSCRATYNTSEVFMFSKTVSKNITVKSK